jgi:hypothetical protein
MTGTNLDRVAKLLADAGRRFASVPVIVLTTRHLVRYQWLLRELGAQYVASSAAHIHDVVGIVNRYVVSLPTTESNRPLAATIRDRLPWREPRERRSPGRE